jgi:predicted phosphodiesterase
MHIAIISDIHGNLEALSAVLEYLNKNNIKQIYCLGDIVGYGPNPNECIKLIKDYCKKVVIGNHDHAALGLTSTEYFNDFAKIATYWTTLNLTSESREYIASLHFTYKTKNYLLVHSTPSNPAIWHYILSENDANYEFGFFRQKLCFIGHSHFPIVFSLNGYSRSSQFKLEENNRYIINVGSVGQPRDGNPKACFCIYNNEKEEISYIRLDYDIERVKEKIVKARLPYFLADRLSKGY